MYIKYKIGLSTDSWGTPNITERGIDEVLLRCIWHLFLKINEIINNKKIFCWLCHILIITIAFGILGKICILTDWLVHLLFIYEVNKTLMVYINLHRSIFYNKFHHTHSQNISRCEKKFSHNFFLIFTHCNSEMGAFIHNICF